MTHARGLIRATAEALVDERAAQLGDEQRITRGHLDARLDERGVDLVLQRGADELRDAGRRQRPESHDDRRRARGERVEDILLGTGFGGPRGDGDDDRHVLQPPGEAV